MDTYNSDEIQYRPNFHFTPKKNWMNDPNGMFYLNGKYHLYFQHNPEANVWGPMHWGHATSEDLIHWEQQPIALFPDALGTIFSGSAVVDFKNTSGLGSIDNPPIVAIYTNHDQEGAANGGMGFQSQSIAYSLDEGQTWKKYDQNPVLKNEKITDFRDPKVFWFEPDQKWIMTLAAGQETQFFASPDLKQWTFLSSFGQGIGNHEGVWECPDLFPLPVLGSSKTKWVHLVSINPGGPNGGSATQYFVGDFDGKKFTIDSAFETTLEKSHTFWTDFGRDNYAGVTFHNWKSKNQGVLYMGWMSNWDYANQVPTTTWRSAMTLGRELQLIQTDDTYRLRSLVPNNWESYIHKTKKEESLVFEGETILIQSGEIDLRGARIQLRIDQIKNKTHTFILKNGLGNILSFGYNAEKQQFFIDRRASGKVDFAKKFPVGQSIAPRTNKSENLWVDFILDKTSIELFFDQGETVLTEIFFPESPYETLTLRVEGKTELSQIEIQELKKK